MSSSSKVERVRRNEIVARTVDTGDPKKENEADDEKGRESGDVHGRTVKLYRNDDGNRAIWTPYQSPSNGLPLMDSMPLHYRTTIDQVLRKRGVVEIVSSLTRHCCPCVNRLWLG